VFTWRLGGLTITMSAERGSARSAAEEIDPGLHALAAELRAALRPMAPPPAFRKELGRELVAAARQRRSVRIVVQRPRDYRRGLLIGAAAVSSAVSVAGLVALLWRHRGRQMAPGTF